MECHKGFEGCSMVQFHLNQDVLCLEGSDEWSDERGTKNPFIGSDERSYPPGFDQHIVVMIFHIVVYPSHSNSCSHTSRFL